MACDFRNEEASFRVPSHISSLAGLLHTRYEKLHSMKDLAKECLGASASYCFAMARSNPEQPERLSPISI